MWIYCPPLYIPGVPARDLSDEEWDALPEEIRELAQNQGVYRRPARARSTGGER